MLMRFDPFRQLDEVAQTLVGRTAERQRMMAMDAYRDGDRFVVKFDLPGVDPQSIDLTAEQNVLTVRAERTWQPAEGQEVIVIERPQGRFSRQLFLGDGLDTENIAAVYDHGVLTVTIPVADQAKPRKVEIVAGNGAQGGAPRPIEAEASGG